MSDPLSPVILNKVESLPTGAVKSIQTGYVSAAVVSGGTNYADEDFYYADITVSSVDPAKCLIVCDCTFGLNASSRKISAPSEDLSRATGRLTSPTNLRLSGHLTNKVTGRWTIVEFM